MTSAVIAMTALGAAGALRLYWAAGGRRGREAAIPRAGGKALFDPGPVTTFLVAVGLFVLAGLIAWRDGLIDLPLPFAIARVGVPLCAIMFLARAIGDFRHVGWTKQVRDSRIARLDDLLYAPLCLLLAACFGVASIG